MAKGKTLDLTIQLAGKIDPSLTTIINSVSQTFTQTLSHIGTAGLAAMSAFVVGTAKVLADCAQEAEKFESSMGNVVKYVDGLADKNGEISANIWEGNGQTYAENYEQMSKALLDLSTEIPMAAEELTQLTAAAGQSGKTQTDLIQYDPNGNLGGFLKDVAMMGTAMDISAEQAGDWAAKWEKALVNAALSNKKAPFLFRERLYLNCIYFFAVCQIFS